LKKKIGRPLGGWGVGSRTAGEMGALEIGGGKGGKADGGGKKPGGLNHGNRSTETATPLERGGRVKKNQEPNHFGGKKKKKPQDETCYHSWDRGPKGGSAQGASNKNGGKKRGNGLQMPSSFQQGAYL